MTDRERHVKVWAGLQKIARPLMRIMFNEEWEEIEIDGPFLVIANHTNDLDPLILSVCFPKNQFYFVASEHIFRLGFVSKVLEYLVAPIPRKKASSGADTVKMCLRNLKGGNSVGLMAEGEASWDGRTIPVFSATGKLAKSSGASLVTVRISGGYLSSPRWAKTFRRGKVYARPVHVYSPEELSTMTADEVLNHINEDIYLDCWKDEKIAGVSYKGKNLAENIERAVYICPYCGHIGTIKSEGDKFTCTHCGNGSVYMGQGTFASDFVFRNISQWEDYQNSAMKELKGAAFYDENISLTRILRGHGEEHLERGVSLSADGDKLRCGHAEFDLTKINNMSMVQSKRLLFSYEGNYYEIKDEGVTSLRKYLAYWQNKLWEA